MRHNHSVQAALFTALLSLVTVGAMNAQPISETPAQHDARMQWWREARFGLFIHWGLYAIPAGEWQGNTEHGEWIMHTARIPVEQYEQLRSQFNPVKFDANSWVRLAKEAGMRQVEVRVAGPGSGRESAIRGLSTAGIEVKAIRDVTPIPHNGCRPPKRRRV